MCAASRALIVPAIYYQFSKKMLVVHSIWNYHKFIPNNGMINGLGCQITKTQIKRRVSVVTYPIRIDLSMHSLQKRCRHSITVRVFFMIPVQPQGKNNLLNVPPTWITRQLVGAINAGIGD
jgi:hypothetical protein